MKVIEIINFNRELLKKLQEAGVRLEDVQYVELYSEYMYRTSQGEKVSYVVAVLSEKYSVSERTFMPWLSGFGVTVRRLQYERAVLSGGLCCFSYL